ncbi:unnamed protein product [Meganyctiphanes norvegica]|uniref:Uncharacterized protein n=1 Tax=Meganyctiphanes norvegica TaxID=48144 RepID=A0AAV2S6N5_MEGNR
MLHTPLLVFVSVVLGVAFAAPALRPVVHQHQDTPRLLSVVRQQQDSPQLLQVVRQKDDIPQLLSVVHLQDTPQQRPVFYQGQGGFHGSSGTNHGRNPPQLRTVVHQQPDTTQLRTVIHQQQSSPQLLSVVRQPVYNPQVRPVSQ